MLLNNCYNYTVKKSIIIIDYTHSKPVVYFHGAIIINIIIITIAIQKWFIWNINKVVKQVKIIK